MVSDGLELKQILNGKIDNSIICPRLSGIYFLLKGQDVVYVGQSVNTFKRILDHISDKRKRFDSFYVLDANKEDLNTLEHMYILKFKPIHNFSKKMDRFVVPKIKGEIKQVATIKIPPSDVEKFETIKRESGLEKCNDIMLYLIRTHTENNTKTNGERND